MTTAISISDKIRSAFNFSVDKYRLSGPDNMKTDHFGLFRSDTLQCVGKAVSGKYEPHTTEDVVALAEAAETAFDNEAEVHCYFREGHHLTIRPSKDYRKSVYGSSDNIWPRMIISAGYDGNSFSASLGLYRDVCQNMMMIRSVSEASAHIRHTKSLRSKMDSLIQTFSQLKNSWIKVTDVVAHMENTQTDLAAFLDRVYGEPKESKRGATTHRDRTTDIFNRLRDERFATGRPPMGKDNQVSVWEAFNAVQGFAQHGTTRHEKNSGKFTRILLAFDDPHVFKAEKLAMSLIA